VVGRAGRRHIGERLFEPRVGRAPEPVGRAGDLLAVGDAQRFPRRLVDAHDLVIAVERDDGVGERAQNAVGVLLQRQHVGEQLGVLQRGRGLRGEVPQAPLVRGGKASDMLVERFEHARRMPLGIDDGDTEEVARDIARARVDGGIKAPVGAHVGHRDDFARGEARAGDTGLAGDADLVDLAAGDDARPQLVRDSVVDEERRALAIEQVGGARDDALEELVEVELDGDGLCRREQLLVARARAPLLLVSVRPAERGRGLRGNRLKEREIDLVEAPLALVQHLEHAEYPSVARP